MVKQLDKNRSFAILSGEEAKSNPYPIVMVTSDGAVHELDQNDRQHLETEYHPLSHTRPYIKQRYLEKNLFGNLAGYCPRTLIPSQIPINVTPFHRAHYRFFASKLNNATE